MSKRDAFFFLIILQKSAFGISFKIQLYNFPLKTKKADQQIGQSKYILTWRGSSIITQ